MRNKLFIGWGEADITPPAELDVELTGQYYQRVATGIHSRLKAVTMLLKQEEKHSLMISLDVAGVPADFCEKMQYAINRRFAEINADKIIINATHTHCAPGLSNFANWWGKNTNAISCEEYRDFVAKKILEAVQKAWDSKEQSGISSSLAFASIGHCRRVLYADNTAEMYGSTNRNDFIGLEGGEDSSFDLLFTFSQSGKPTGAIVNVPCPSQVMEATYKISSDFMGRLRDLLKKRLGEDFHTLCQISPAGCQSPRDLTRSQTNARFWNETGVEIIAKRLFSSIIEEYEKLSHDINYNITLEHLSEEIELPRRRVSDNDYQEAQEKMRELEKIQPSREAYLDFCEKTHANEKKNNTPGPYDSKLHHFVKIRNCEAVVKRFAEQNKSPSLKMQLHVIRLANLVFTTNPFELYLNFGHQIRSRSKAEQTFMIQLANGIGGYLPSKRAEQLGGYGGLVINGEVGSNGGLLLVDKTTEKINELFRDK